MANIIDLSHSYCPFTGGECKGKKCMMISNITNMACMPHPKVGHEYYACSLSAVGTDRDYFTTAIDLEMF